MKAETTFSPQQPHNKLLILAAREVLRPLGLVQRGRSRTWIDDHGWWLGVVEFQPSSWSRGSYLNVGVNWLWNPKDYLSFDDEVTGENHHTARVHLPGDVEYFEYESDEQFAPLAGQLAKLAADEAQRLRALFPTLEAAAAALRVVEDLARSVDAGVALGLVGDEVAARAMFSRYIDWFDAGGHLHWPPPRVDPRYERAQRLRDLARDEQKFRERIRADVREGTSAPQA